MCLNYSVLNINVKGKLIVTPLSSYSKFPLTKKYHERYGCSVDFVYKQYFFAEFRHGFWMATASGVCSHLTYKIK
jgi:hypothetical protein